MMDGEKTSKPNNTRIVWARGLSNQDIADLLQMKLLESRASRGTQVSLLNELVHEIKFRLADRPSVEKGVRKGDDA